MHLYTFILHGMFIITLLSFVFNFSRAQNSKHTFIIRNGPSQASKRDKCDLSSQARPASLGRVTPDPFVKYVRYTVKCLSL